MKKTLQVLEVSAGIATFLLTLPNVYLTYISYSDWIQESRITTEEILIPAVLFLIVPALLVAIGSYFHSFKHNTVGFLILFACGSFLTVTHALFALVGSAFKGYPLLGISPGFFAFITIIIALCRTLWSLKEDGNYSQ